MKLKLEQGSDEWHALRHKARTDLYWFNAKVLRHENVVPMSPRAHYGMCKFASRDTGFERIDSCRVQVIQVPRGVGKSTLITKGRTIQRLVQDRNWAAGIANEVTDLAQGFLGGIKQEWESNEFLKGLFPECVPDIRKTIWKSDAIVINRTRANPVSPSVRAAGVNTTVTGVHQNEWICDDLMSQNAAENARAGLFTELEKTKRWISRLPPLLQNPERDPITFICTPWFLGDVYDWLIDEFFGNHEPEEYYPMHLELPDGTEQTIKLMRKGDVAVFRLPAIDEHGTPLFPERYDLEELQAMKRRDSVFFSAQYMLNPAAEAAAFKEEWLKEFEWESARQIRFKNADGRVEFLRLADLTTILSVDPAISQSQGSANSAITVVGTDGKRQFLLEAWRGKVGATSLATKILELYQKYHPIRIIVETVAYQEALAEILDMLAREYNVGAMLPIYEHKTGPHTKKELRILGLEPFFRKGLFYHHASQREFLEEYTHFPHAKLRDLLDALSFQKDMWESLSSMVEGSGGYLKEWKSRDAERAQRVRDALGRKRRT